MENLVSEKLGVKPGSRAILINAPASAVRAIKLPPLKKAVRLAGEFDYIHFFAYSQAELDKKLPSLKKHLKLTGMLGYRGRKTNNLKLILLYFMLSDWDMIMGLWKVRQ